MKESEKKAKELVEMFEKHVDFTNDDGFTCYESKIKRSKQCALICVEEIIKEGYDNNMYQSRLTFWQEVKQEIIKL